MFAFMYDSNVVL